MQRLRLLRAARNLGLRVLVRAAELLRQLPAPGAVGLHIRPQRRQILPAAQGALALGLQCRQRGFMLRNLLRQVAAARQQLRLSGELLARLGAQRLHLPLAAVDRLLRTLRAGPVGRGARGDRLRLVAQAPTARLQTLGQHVVVVLAPLERQHAALGLALLLLGDVELILRLLQVARRLRRALLRLMQLLLKPALLFAQGRELRRARQDARAAADAAAGHRAAGMDDLSVQRHDAEAVPVPPGDGDAAVDVLDHDRPPQQVLENAVILPVIAHKAARDADKARLLLQSLLAQGISAHGAHREERRAAAVALL